MGDDGCDGFLSKGRRKIENLGQLFVSGRDFFFFLVCCVVSQNAGFSTLVEYTSHLTESARDSFIFCSRPTNASIVHTKKTTLAG